MPTLADYTQAEVDRLTTAATEANDDLVVAYNARTAAKNTLDSAVSDFADAVENVKAVRKALGLSEVAAAVTPLVDDLRDAIVARNAAESALILAKVALASAESDVKVARAWADKQAAALGDALEAKEEADARATRLAQWVVAKDEPPLSTVAADATALKADASYTTAETKITDAMPAELLARARARSQAVVDEDEAAAAHTEAIRVPVFAKLTADAGYAGPVPGLDRDLEAADEALRVLISTSADRLAEATSRLEAIAARVEISQAVRDALDTDPDRDAAQAAEAARDAEIVNLAAAFRAFEVAKGTLYASDPDGDETALPEFTAWTDIRDVDLPAAEAAYDAAMRDTMAAWQAEVPASVWADLLDFDVASRILDDLIALDIDAALMVVDNAETALVAALEAELLVDRGLEKAAQPIDGADRYDTDARNASELRQKAALRGLN